MQDIEKWTDEQKAQKGLTTLNYIKHFLISASTTTGCILISAFPSLLDTPIAIVSFVKVLKIRAITVLFRKYISIIGRKKKKYHKIVLVAKSKLNRIKVLISAALNGFKYYFWWICFKNSVLKEYDDIKKKNLKT